MCDIVFEKAKFVVGKYIERGFMQRKLSEGFFKNFSEFTRKHLCWNLFFDKV